MTKARRQFHKTMTGIHLHCIGKLRERHFGFYDRKRYDRLLEVADEVIVLSESYYPRCFLDRDEFMVNNSSLLIRRDR